MPATATIDVETIGLAHWLVTGAHLHRPDQVAFLPTQFYLGGEGNTEEVGFPFTEAVKLSGN